MSRRILFNIGANSSAMVVTIFGQIALVPLFLSYWSVATYADWLVLMTVPSMVLVLNGGLGVITGVQLTLHLERDEEAEGQRLFRQMLGVLVVVGVALFALARLPPVDAGLYWLLHPGTITSGELTAIITILIAYVMLAMVQSVVRALYRASEMEFLGISFQTGGRIVEYGAIAGTVLLGGGFLDTAIAMTLASALTTVVLAVHSQRLRCTASLVPLWPSWLVWRFFLVDGLPVVAVQAGTRCSQQGMLILLNHLLDARAVLLVGTLQTVQRALSQLPMLLSWSHAPDITTAFARREPARLARLLAVSQSLSLGCGLAAGVGIVALGPWLYSLWVRGAGLDPSRGLFVVLAIDTVVLSLWWPLGVALNATKHHRLWSWFYVVAVVGALAFVRPLVPLAGAATPFVLSVFTGAAMTLFVARATHRLLRDSQGFGLGHALACHPWWPRRRAPTVTPGPLDSAGNDPANLPSVGVSRPCSEPS